MMRTRSLLSAVVVSLLASFAAAQDFPSKPIRLLVGFPPGGSTDVLARVLAQEGRKPLGQEIVVVNRPGASGVIAINEVAAASPDGYTISVSPSSAFTLAHHFMAIRPDLLEATTALMLIGRQRIGIVTHSGSPQRTLKEFVENARKNPGKVSVGIPGLGTKVEVITRAIAMHEKIDLNVVAFQGDAGVITNVLGAHVAAGSFSVGGWATHVRSGAMRLLASFEDDRFDVAPGVPTLVELGYPLTGATIQHLYGPKGLPPAIVRRLVAAFTEASRSQAFIDIATQNGLYDKNPLVGEALDTFLLKDRAANTELVAKLGLGLKKKP
ncbi:MAG: hypothetical protein A3H35_05530 [Betaproteobacteria bacterium RIFCSPLOWO2_02_FULL_62_17]|nr:MAG: hypothetical protein A3H35_05530 [Betaproteobacteria bacterium RIFCSPLOWO2_02_FULL_62_17]